MRNWGRDLVKTSFAAAMSADMWRAFELADMASVKALDAALDFDWCSLSPGEQITPLHCIVRGVAKINSDNQGPVPSDVMDLLSWALERGADPCLRAPKSCSSTIDQHASGLCHYKIVVPYKEHSAISLAVAVRCAMIDKDRSEGYTFWEHSIRRMEMVMDIMRSNIVSKKLTISAGVLQMWEGLRASAHGQDTTFACLGGDIGAHAAVLSAASPVLSAMLNSSMREGDEKRIELRDAPHEVTSLLAEPHSLARYSSALHPNAHCSCSQPLRPSLFS